MPDLSRAGAWRAPDRLGAIHVLTEEENMLAVRLPQDIEDRLNELARRTGRSKSFYAREAILEHLEDLEDLYLAEEALEEHYASGGRTVSMGEVLKRYGG
ncbi:MAG: type II toxin-antitoxin system RelB family antitoxin [Phycicoccus sp.]